MKKAAQTVFIALIAYVAIFIADYIRVINEKPPIFCIKTDHNRYTAYHGPGYSYEIGNHIITGKTQYALFFLGNPVSSDFTNEAIIIH